MQAQVTIITREGAVAYRSDPLRIEDLHWMIGRTIVEIAGDGSWSFRFSGKGSINVDTFWRVVMNGRVDTSSEDHGHQFGLPKPVDAGAEAMNALRNARVKEPHIVAKSGDIVLVFDNGARLEIITTSSGYEGWSMIFPNGEQALGLGGGEAIVLRK